MDCTYFVNKNKPSLYKVAVFVCRGGESNTLRQPLPKAIWTISSPLSFFVK